MLIATYTGVLPDKVWPAEPLIQTQSL